MRPISNGPPRLYAFAKIHKIVNMNDVNLIVMNQMGTYTYNAAQVICDYLKHLCINEYNIKYTLQIPQLIKDFSSFKDAAEYADK